MAARVSPAVESSLGGDVTEDRSVGFVGLGYVGLPLALSCHEAGLRSSAWTPTRGGSRS